MGKSIRDVMTAEPRTVKSDTPIAEAAKAMKEADAGAVVVQDNGSPTGILTDRDIAIRAVAEGRDPTSTPVSEVATKDPTTLSPDDSIDDAVQVMREKNVRRLPVVEDDKTVGIVSLGDLAEVKDEDSALADISAAAPQQ
jgi:CBS domain-containing protein